MKSALSQASQSSVRGASQLHTSANTVTWLTNSPAYLIFCKADVCSAIGSHWPTLDTHTCSAGPSFGVGLTLLKSRNTQCEKYKKRWSGT